MFGGMPLEDDIEYRVTTNHDGCRDLDQCQCLRDNGHLTRTHHSCPIHGDNA